MKLHTVIILIAIIALGCNSDNKSGSNVVVKSKRSYELHHVRNSKSVLILFPGGGGDIEGTKQEFDILPKAIENGISVLIMNFSRHLWIDESQTQKLASDIDEIFKTNNIRTNKVYIGGMSIGGNVALTLSNFLHQGKHSIQPKGVFVVDSPIDLYALYLSSIKDVGNPDFDDERLAEPKFIIKYFNENFSEDSILQNIKKVAPYTLEIEENNFQQLKNSELRFYTEPDSAWWRENRMTDFENTNAYLLKKITQTLKAEGWEKIELIETKNKGYRSNGDRHPHSWSIVDVDDLITWINE